MVKKILAAMLALPLLFGSSTALANNKTEENQILCLAKNMFYEARNQSPLGIIAVAFVTLNRSKDARFPSSVCDVVFERNEYFCQFSWVCQGKPIGREFTLSLSIAEREVYYKIRNMAAHIYRNYHKMNDPTNGALFFHSNYIEKPNWKNVRKTIQIDQHIFYASIK